MLHKDLAEKQKNKSVSEMVQWLRAPTALTEVQVRILVPMSNQVAHNSL